MYEWVQNLGGLTSRPYGDGYPKNFRYGVSIAFTLDCLGAAAA